MSGFKNRMGTYQIGYLILFRSKTRLRSLRMPPGCPSLDTRIQAAMSGMNPTTIGLTGLKPDGMAIGSAGEKCPTNGPISAISNQKSRERANTKTKNVSGDLFKDTLVFTIYRLLQSCPPSNKTMSLSPL